MAQRAVCVQDVDPSFPIWASETLEMGGMCGQAGLARPRFVERIKSLPLLHTGSVTADSETFLLADVPLKP